MAARAPSRTRIPTVFPAEELMKYATRSRYRPLLVVQAPATARTPAYACEPSGNGHG